MTQITRTRRGRELAARNLLADLEEGLRYLEAARDVFRALAQDGPATWASQAASRLDSEASQVGERIRDLRAELGGDVVAPVDLQPDPDLDPEEHFERLHREEQDALAAAGDLSGELVE